MLNDKEQKKEFSDLINGICAIKNCSYAVLYKKFGEKC